MNKLYNKNITQTIITQLAILFYVIYKQGTNSSMKKYQRKASQLARIYGKLQQTINLFLTTAESCLSAVQTGKTDILKFMRIHLVHNLHYNKQTISLLYIAGLTSNNDKLRCINMQYINSYICIVCMYYMGINWKLRLFQIHIYNYHNKST